MTRFDWLTTKAPSATWLLRLAVGSIFLSEGIQKFLFPEALGVGRFEKIGIPMPNLLAPFVGVVEILFGALVVVGLFTRLAAVPLVIDMLVAIGTTKIPMLAKSGFWAMAHEARTDFAMLLGCMFLLVAGAGPASLDARVSTSRTTRMCERRTQSAVHSCVATERERHSSRRAVWRPATPVLRQLR